MKKAVCHHRKRAPHRLFVLTTFIVLSLGCGPISHAVTRDSAPRDEVRHTSAPAVAVDIRPTAATSPYWRSFLWEALPAEWLRGTGDSPVMEAYQHRNWRPIFINSRFELSEQAQSLVNRMDQAGDDAIDSGALKLGAIHKSLKKLEAQRSTLLALEPAMSDTAAVITEVPTFDAPSATSTPSPAPTHVASVAPVAAVAPADEAVRKEHEQKYKDLFRTASEVDIMLASSLMRFAREMDPASEDVQQRALSGETTISEFLSAIDPQQFAQYSALRKVYPLYRELAAQGGPQKLPANMRPGENSAQVRELQKRLHQEGFYAGKVNGTYDAETQEA
ncbi:MAG: peptidoglycan-binding protein, partial [Acidobacteriota bacterium]